MPAVRLTSRNVPTLQAKDGRRTDYFDDVVAGFCLRVSPNDVRTYAMWYRVNGEARRYTIGRAEAVDLADARHRAREILADAKLYGKDATEERRDARRKAERGEDFASLAQRFLERHGPNLRPRSLAEVERTLRVDVFPALGELRPQDITRGDIRTLMWKIADRAPTQANRTFAAIRRVFSWAVGEDLLTLSPCVGLKMPTKEHPRDRIYSNDEIRAIFSAVADTELAQLVPLIFFTGVRSEEARSARWSELDLESKLWTIPSEKSKNHKSHPVPLSDGALRVLGKIQRGAKNDHLFPALTKTGFMDHPQKAIVLVRKTSNVADFRLHDVRRTVATRLAELGTLDAIVEAVLGHTATKLKRTYNRYQPVREMRSALQAWSTGLERIVEGRADEGAKVLPMARAKRPLNAGRRAPEVAEAKR